MPLQMQGIGHDQAVKFLEQSSLLKLFPLIYVEWLNMVYGTWSSSYM